VGSGTGWSELVLVRLNIESVTLEGDGAAWKLRSGTWRRGLAAERDDIRFSATDVACARKLAHTGTW
jgi:hypothetical protein